MVIGFILGILAALVVQETYIKVRLAAKQPPAPVEEVVVPATKKVRKSRAKNSKKG